VFDEAILHEDMAPGTGYPVTRKQWEDGYDAEAYSTTGRVPQIDFHKLRRLVAVTICKCCPQSLKNIATFASSHCGAWSRRKLDVSATSFAITEMTIWSRARDKA
jgi:hypothetical protein